MDKRQEKIAIISSLVALSALIVTLPGYALSLNGFTEFDHILRLNAPVAGMVKNIRVKPGQRVNVNQTLIELDETGLKAELGHAQATARALMPAVDTAQLEMDRAQELYDRDSLSQVELKNAENSLAAAEGHYQAVQAQVALAKYRLQLATIRAPVEGRVLDVAVNVSQYLDPEVDISPVIFLTDATRMKAVALLKSEQWSGELLGRPASITYRDQSYAGKVSYIGYNRIKQPGGLSAYEIHVLFETDHLIPAGMPVAIKIDE
jgi:RND family efflux transporter MFP subunit